MNIEEYALNKITSEILNEQYPYMVMRNFIQMFLFPNVWKRRIVN